MLLRGQAASTVNKNSSSADCRVPACSCREQLGEDVLARERSSTCHHLGTSREPTPPTPKRLLEARGGAIGLLRRNRRTLCVASTGKRRRMAWPACTPFSFGATQSRENGKNLRRHPLPKHSRKNSEWEQCSPLPIRCPQPKHIDSSHKREEARSALEVCDIPKDFGDAEHAVQTCEFVCTASRGGAGSFASLLERVGRARPLRTVLIRLLPAQVRAFPQHTGSFAMCCEKARKHGAQPAVTFPPLRNQYISHIDTSWHRHFGHSLAIILPRRLQHGRCT